MSALEAQLTGLTVEFVARLVEAIRGASFADVAGLSTGKLLAATGRASIAARPPRHPPIPAAEAGTRRRSRQTAGHRAELGGRIADTLKAAHEPMGVRALAAELGVSPDRLAAPLKELRASNQVHKHGDKRNTTYSAV